MFCSTQSALAGDRMRFAHFILDGKECFGTAVGDSILPFSALPDSSPCSSFTLDRLLQDGNALERLRKEDLPASDEVADSLVGEDEVEFLGCVPRPSKIICVGLNYRLSEVCNNSWPCEVNQEQYAHDCAKREVQEP